MVHIERARPRPEFPTPLHTDPSSPTRETLRTGQSPNPPRGRCYHPPMARRTNKVDPSRVDHAKRFYFEGRGLLWDMLARERRVLRIADRVLANAIKRGYVEEGDVEEVAALRAEAESGELATLNATVKSQRVRVLDVVVLGPLMMAGGAAWSKKRPLAGAILLLSGIGTVLYNARNWKRVRRATRAGRAGRTRGR